MDKSPSDHCCIVAQSGWVGGSHLVVMEHSNPIQSNLASVKMARPLALSCLCGVYFFCLLEVFRELCEALAWFTLLGGCECATLCEEVKLYSQSCLQSGCKSVW